MSYYDGVAYDNSSFKITIATGLVEAEQQTNEHYEQYETDCAKGQYVWNERYKKIKHRLPEDVYSVKYRKKGNWPYMLIMDDSIDWLFILLNQNLFDGLLRHPSKRTHHYAKPPALRNEDLNKYTVLNEQMCVWGWEKYEEDEETLEFRKDDLSKVEVLFGKSIKRYVVLSFKPHQTMGISSLSANLVDSDFKLKKTESWNSYIPSSTYPFEPDLDKNGIDLGGTMIFGANNRIDSKPKPQIIKKPKEKDNH